MLTPIELKPHLLDRDRLVRDAVARYFRDSWSHDHELLPLILESVRRFGSAETGVLLGLARYLPLSAEVAPELLEVLGAANEWPMAHALNDVIARAPLSVIEAHETRILAADGLRPEVVERVQRRRELSSWPAEKLWLALEEYAQDPPGPYVDDLDRVYVEDVIDALGRRSQPDADTLCARLVAEEGWLEIFAVDLAGQRGVREAVPALVDKFTIDADYLLERASDALVRIGDETAVELIARRYAGEHWNFRNYAIGVLGCLKGQASEQALLELLEIERDPGLRVWLCLGLCQQFSRLGLDVVLREIGRGYEPGFATLEEEVLPVAELLEVDLPRGAEWRAQAEQERRRIEATIAELDTPSAIAAPAGTVRRVQPNVGRNEPCPCGSGRKYKKCCGRSS